MQCPKCGYMMSPFDVACARCARMPTAPLPAPPVVPTVEQTHVFAPPPPPQYQQPYPPQYQQPYPPQYPQQGQYIPPQNPFIRVLNQCAKWGAICWSGICLLGLLYGMMNVGAALNKTPYQSEASRAGAGIGIAIGIGMWAFIWAAIAGPCGLVWLLTRSRTDP